MRYSRDLEAYITAIRTVGSNRDLEADFAAIRTPSRFRRLCGDIAVDTVEIQKLMLRYCIFAQVETFKIQKLN